MHLLVNAEIYFKYMIHQLVDKKYLFNNLKFDIILQITNQSIYADIAYIQMAFFKTCAKYLVFLLFAQEIARFCVKRRIHALSRCLN